MLKHLYLILIATFIFGFISGMILYLYNHTGEEAGTNYPFFEEPLEDFSIIAYTYGGCLRTGGCSTYRIAEDGSYTYVVRSGGEEERYEGSLPENQYGILRARLGATDLVSVKETGFSGVCSADTNGTAYRFDIRYGGEEFSFDSCGEDLEDEPLFATLEGYFVELNGNTGR